MPDTRVITLHRHAPPKPAYGAPCNGCGICCTVEPCPVAIFFLWQSSVPCRALRWQESSRRYVCGMATCPDHYVRLISPAWRERAGRFFATRIAAGDGCDSAAEIRECT